MVNLYYQVSFVVAFGIEAIGEGEGNEFGVFGCAGFVKDCGDLFVDCIGLVAQFKTGVVAVKTFAKQGNDFCFVKGYFFSAEFKVFCFHLKSMFWFIGV